MAFDGTKGDEPWGDSADGDVFADDPFEAEEPDEDWDDEESDEDWDDDEDEEDDEDDDDWDDDEESDEWEEWDDDFAPRETARTLSFGLVAMAPLVLVYEIGLALERDTGARSVAEAILAFPLRPLDPVVASVVRRGGMVVVLLLALLVSARRSQHLTSRILRVIGEGLVGALLLGPLLSLAAAYVEPYVGRIGHGGGGLAGATDFTRIALASGGAAFEEILFRVLLLSLVYVGARGLFLRLGTSERSAVLLGAATGTLVSALAFAAFHVDRCIAWVGAGGEPFDPASFTWRAMAGIVLAGIAVWRGVGVAAWSHALFNLALILGIR